MATADDNDDNHDGGDSGDDDGDAGDDGDDGDDGDEVPGDMGWLWGGTLGHGVSVGRFLGTRGGRGEVPGDTGSVTKPSGLEVLHRCHGCHCSASGGAVRDWLIATGALGHAVSHAVGQGVRVRGGWKNLWRRCFLGKEQAKSTGKAWRSHGRGRSLHPQVGRSLMCPVGYWNAFSSSSGIMM